MHDLFPCISLYTNVQKSSKQKLQPYITRNSVSWVIFDNYNKYDLSYKKSGRYNGQMLTKINKTWELFMSNLNTKFTDTKGESVKQARNWSKTAETDVTGFRYVWLGSSTV